jgi:hypothetical protein
MPVALLNKKVSNTKNGLEKLKQETESCESGTNQMKGDTADYETEGPGVALEGLDFCKDKVSWITRALVTLFLVLVYSIGLPSSGLARDNLLPNNRA